jgi:hypothetical protein
VLCVRGREGEARIKKEKEKKNAGRHGKVGSGEMMQRLAGPGIYSE